MPVFLNELMLANDVASFRKHHGKEQCCEFHDSHVFRFGPVALEFGPAAQEDFSHAPISESLFGACQVSCVANVFEVGPNTEEEVNSLIISRNPSKQVHEFSDGFRWFSRVSTNPRCFLNMKRTR